MGVIYRNIRVPDEWHYEPEFNKDGTEKHISCDGARYHVLSYSYSDKHGCQVHCSEPKCEMNKGDESNADA